jgi:L-ascorbate metabolism protein UlaG (beta-lactamase superfamily)
MKNIGADVALLPVLGTLRDDGRRGRRSGEAMGPRLAVPMHYGTVVGDEEDARTFKENCSVPVKILERE